MGKRTDIMENMFFLFQFSFLLWLTEGSENQQGGVGWALEHSPGRLRSVCSAGEPHPGLALARIKLHKQ